ncbi:MAG: hypothetical protein XU11_C0015G0048, partial [Candidatus Dadabacteria bacterium CSP1-2]
KGSELRLRTRFEMTKYPSDHYESCSGQGSQRLAEWIASLHKSLYYPTNVGLVPRTGIDMRTDTVISPYIFFSSTVCPTNVGLVPRTGIDMRTDTVISPYIFFSLRYDTPWDDYSSLSVILLLDCFYLFNIRGLFLFEAGTEPCINYLFCYNWRGKSKAHC